MKKFFLTCVFSLLVGVYAMAASGLTLVKGDVKFLKSAEGIVVLEYVWDNATYAYKQPLTEKFANLEELKPIAWNGFAQDFNKHSKKLKVSNSVENAKYKFSMKVKNMDQYFKVTGFIPANATKVWGVMTITDLSTGEVVAVVDVAAVDGGANPSPGGTFSDCFERLGKEFAKMK